MSAEEFDTRQVSDINRWAWMDSNQRPRCYQDWDLVRSLVPLHFANALGASPRDPKGLHEISRYETGLQKPPGHCSIRPLRFTKPLLYH